MRSSRIWLCVFLILLGAETWSHAGLKVYFLRHAEGGHNVVRQWQDKPRDEWPDYVGKENRFTPKGEEQIAAVPAKLAPYHFDFIAVSPLWRTRNTVLPYLKEKGRKAEIWPELEEFAFKDFPLPWPPPSPDLFQGEKLRVPEGEKEWFYLRSDAANRIKPGKNDVQARANVDALMQRIVALLRQTGRRENSVLLVGHGNSSALLLRALIGKNPGQLVNTGLWMAEEQPDGRFELRIFNDKNWP